MAHGTDAGPAGWAAYDAKHYEQAVRLWAPAAEAGDPGAQFGLGLAYDLGQGAAPDPLAACAWYRRAGAGGHAAGAFNAAVLIDGGRCGPRQPALAALWYARAAAAGHPRAQFNMGQLYEAGDGVPRNPDMAAAWFRAAAANGILAAAARGAAAAQPIRRAGLPQPPLAAAPAGTADAPPAPGGMAALVWTAPPQAGPVRFFLEVVAQDAAGTHELVARYVDESAAQVQLPPANPRLFWRVMTVSPESSRYTATSWQRLDARP